MMAWNCLVRDWIQQCSVVAVVNNVANISINWKSHCCYGQHVANISVITRVVWEVREVGIIKYNMCNTILGVVKFKVVYTNGIWFQQYFQQCPITKSMWGVGNRTPYICILNFELSNAEFMAIALWSNIILYWHLEPYKNCSTTIMVHVHAYCVCIVFVRIRVLCYTCNADFTNLPQSWIHLHNNIIYGYEMLKRTTTAGPCRQHLHTYNTYAIVNVQGIRIVIIIIKRGHVNLKKKKPSKPRRRNKPISYDRIDISILY